MARRSPAASAGQFLADALLGSILFLIIVALSGVCIGGGAQAEPGRQVPHSFIVQSPGEPLAAPDSEPVHDRAAKAAAIEVQKPRQAAMMQTDHRTMIWVLGFVFSALVALNIGFVRHLRRTYARAR